MQTHPARAAIPAIIVMGVSGSGKSTLGAALARELGCAFLEGDEFHAPESVAKMRSGQPLTDEDRWPWLDRLGAAMREATKDTGAVATCSALKRIYRDRLVEAAKTRLLFVLLATDREELARRMAARPNHYMPASLLDSQLATLERPAAEEGALVLDATRRREDLLAEVLTRLGR